MSILRIQTPTMGIDLLHYVRLLTALLHNNLFDVLAYVGIIIIKRIIPSLLFSYSG